MLSRENNVNEKIYRKSKGWQFLKIPEFSALISLIILMVIFTLINQFFISMSNINIILTSTSFSGIIAIGMALVFISGQFDLSAGAVTGFVSVIAAVFMAKLNLPVWLSLSLALLIALLIGLINGIMTVKLKIPPIVGTLGMMFMLMGGNLILTKGYTIFPLPESFNNLGRTGPLGLSWSFVIFVVLVCIFDFVLRKTILGRRIYTVGANVNVARIMGINSDSIKIFVYMLVSFLAGLSGILFMAKIRTGSPEIGEGWILLIVAATVIGGVSIYGGYGTILGVVLGSLIIWVMRSGLAMIGSRAEWQNVTIGIILILATIYDFFKQRLKLSD